MSDLIEFITPEWQNIDLFTVEQGVDERDILLRAGMVARSCEAGVIASPLNIPERSAEADKQPWELQCSDDHALTQSLEKLGSGRTAYLSDAAVRVKELGSTVDLDALRLEVPQTDELTTAADWLAMIAIVTKPDFRIVNGLYGLGSNYRKVYREEIALGNQAVRHTMHWLILNERTDLWVADSRGAEPVVHVVRYQPRQHQLISRMHGEGDGGSKKRGPNDDDPDSGDREPRKPRSPRDSASIALKPKTS